MANDGVSASEVVQLVREKLSVQSGRHLYGVLGTFEQMEAFKVEASAASSGGAGFPPARNLAFDLLGMLDEDLFQDLLAKEAKRPKAVREQLNQLLNMYLTQSLKPAQLLTLEGLEMMFIYELDFSLIRVAATNNRHLLLLIPGMRQSGSVVVYPGGEDRFRRTLPPNFIADDHLWELK